MVYTSEDKSIQYTAKTTLIFAGISTRPLSTRRSILISTRPAAARRSLRSCQLSHPQIKAPPAGGGGDPAAPAQGQPSQPQAAHCDSVAQGGLGNTGPRDRAGCGAAGHKLRAALQAMRSPALLSRPRSSLTPQCLIRWLLAREGQWVPGIRKSRGGLLGPLR